MILQPADGKVKLIFLILNAVLILVLCNLLLNVCRAALQAWDKCNQWLSSSDWMPLSTPPRPLEISSKSPEKRLLFRDRRWSSKVLKDWCEQLDRMLVQMEFPG